MVIRLALFKVLFIGATAARAVSHWYLLSRSIHNNCIVYRLEKLHEKRVYRKGDSEPHRPNARIHVRSTDRNGTVAANGFSKARQVGHDAESECDDGSPIPARGVPVWCVTVPFAIETWEVEKASGDDPVVSEEHTTDGSEENTISSKEIRERHGRVLDLPRNSDETKESTDVLAATDVDILWENDHEVIRDCGGVGGDIGRDDAQAPAEGTEELCGPAFEKGTDLKRRPSADSIDDFDGRRNNDA